jgi:hypothetical protein
MNEKLSLSSTNETLYTKNSSKTKATLTFIQTHLGNLYRGRVIFTSYYPT